MKLWSLHDPGFCLTTQIVDHSKSDYCEHVAKYNSVVRELARRLGTDRLIWCHTVEEEPYEGRVRWILDVPEAELRFVDTLVWNRLLGIRCALPRSMRFRWKDMAMDKYPNDAKQRHQYEEEL